MSEAQTPAMPKRILFCIWQQFPIPMVSRYLAQMGWDWIILDMQHGPMSAENAYECIHTIRAAGSKPLVRVPIGGYSDIQKHLDLGAQGIVVPMVNSLDEAKNAVMAAKYPTLGGRSVGGDAKYHYGRDYPLKANRETLLLVQIEHIDAVCRVEEIMSVQGVDGCFIGPADLAFSMGLSGTDFENAPELQAAIQRTLIACEQAGKISGCHTYSLLDAKAKADQGCQCISLQVDIALFVGAAQELLASLRSQVKGVPRTAMGEE
jgi:4-hydroxy-2-oxoheptanedioate aldolase